MCGITGFVDFKKCILNEEQLLNASYQLKHRGGCGSGHFFASYENYNVGFANERLATIATDDNGLQPFTSLCGNYIITFNGTIYNHNQIRTELKSLNVNFKSSSDTEVLLQSYIYWGKDLFKKIDGAFAFAIFDKQKQKLFIARDAMGVKPLYIYYNASFLSFSSEIKSILQYRIVKKINRKALANYFRKGYFLGDETIYDQVFSFKKQHYLEFDLLTNQLNEKEYLLDYGIEVPETEQEILKDLAQLVEKSVLSRAVTDVSEGVLLSGGYDSATVASVLQKHSDSKVKTFTLGFENCNLNEANDAQRIASFLKTDHHTFFINEKSAIETLESMPIIFDEPNGDSGSIALANVVNKVSDFDVKVLLGAEGGDELFAGYANYTKAQKLNQFNKYTPQFIKKTISKFSNSRKEKLDELFKSNTLLETYEVITSYFSNLEISRLLNADVSSFVDNNNSTNIKCLLHYDLENYLPNDLLLKSDRIAMHYNIDNRDALLSTELAAYLQKVPSTYLLKDKTLKYLLKKITHQLIPETLMNKQKRGFSIPITEWMGTIFKPYLQDYLSTDSLNKHKLFNNKEVEKIMKRFEDKPSGNDAKKLWLLLQFQMWYRYNFN